MSLRLLAAFACGLLLTSDSFGQYQHPAYQQQGYPQSAYQQTGYSFQQTPVAGYRRAAAQLQSQSRAVAPPQVSHVGEFAPALQGAPVPQTPLNYSELPPLVPSMTVPSCGQDCAQSRNQVGTDYFGCPDGSDIECCCDECDSDRYVRVFGGWNWLQDVEANLQTALVNGRASFNDGWAIGGSLGKYITPRTRREFEFTYRNNSAGSIIIPAILPIDGVVNCYSMMGNLVYELPNAKIAAFKPYFGGGLGVAHVDGEFDGGAVSIDDTVFAYQAFAGVDRQLNSNAKLFIEYRYFASSEVEIDAIIPASDEYEANNLFFGLQVRR